MSNRRLAAAQTESGPALFRVTFAAPIEAFSHDDAAQLIAAALRSGAISFDVRRCGDVIASGQVAKSVRVTVPAPVVSEPRAQISDKSRKAAKAKAPADGLQPGERFILAYREAAQRAIAELGPMWRAQPGGACYADIPAALRSYYADVPDALPISQGGPRGTKITFKGFGLPAARFWAGGVLPDGIEAVTYDASRVTMSKKQTENPEAFAADVMRAWRESPESKQRNDGGFFDWLQTQNRGPHWRHDPAERLANAMKHAAGKLEDRRFNLEEARRVAAIDSYLSNERCSMHVKQAWKAHREAMALISAAKES